MKINIQKTHQGHEHQGHEHHPNKIHSLSFYGDENVKEDFYFLFYVNREMKGAKRRRMNKGRQIS